MLRFKTVLLHVFAALSLLLFAGGCIDSSGGDGGTGGGGYGAGADGGGGGGGGSNQCPAGQRLNVLTGACEAVSGTDGGFGDAGTSTDGGSGGGGGNSDGGSLTDVPTTGCGPGTVIGKACAPSGELLAGAEVTITGANCDGSDYTQTVTTDANGEYRFDNVPAGQHTLTISTGSFSRDKIIIVQTGQTLDLGKSASKVCLDSGGVEMAVIKGKWDKVELLLDDLGLEYDFKGDDQPSFSSSGTAPPAEATTFLSDLSAMNQYDIIFINCGMLWAYLGAYGTQDQKDTIIDNIKTFVDSGKSLYVSDFAHPFIEKTFPDAITFHGNEDNEARIGYAPQTVTADVTSTQLQNVLNSNATSIDFPHGSGVENTFWVVADSIGSSSTTHLEADVDLCSSTSSCSSTGGTQQDAKLLVTHRSPGGGTAIFTAFHNHSQQGTLNDDMEKILKFLIFQL